MRRRAIPDAFERIARAGVLVALAAVLALGASPAAAQMGDRVEEELRRTDEALERVADVVRESGSDRARQILGNAVDVQRGAWGAFRNGNRLMAGRMTFEAREIGARALTLAREDTSLRDRAQREMERGARALGRVREELGDAPSPQVVVLLEEARALLERGRVSFGEQRYHAALRLALSAQRLVRQAGALASETSGARVQRELERTDALLERVAPSVRESDREDVARLFRRAGELQAQAWESFRAGPPRAALARTREARGIANRVRGLLQVGGSPEAVQQALGETDRLLGRAADVVRESGNARAESVLERALDHQERAREFLDQGRLRSALAQTRVARSLAKRAVALAEEDTL